LGDSGWIPDFFAPFEPVTSSHPRNIISMNTHFLDLTPVYGGGQSNLALRNSSDYAYLALESRQYTGFPFYFGNALQRGETYGTKWNFRGDIRTNKVPPMKILTDVFIKSHNRIAEMLETDNADLYQGTDGRSLLFEDARRLNIAMYQRACFREYLGVLLGRPLDPYDKNQGLLLM
jgi:hypothetical protein